MRFSEDLWEMLEHEASRQGTSAAQLIREAAILRGAVLAARRGDPALELTIDKLADRARAHGHAAREDGNVRDSQRLAAVHATGLLDDGSDPCLDRLADAARRVMNAPVAMITLIDAERQYFVSAPGLREPWASRRQSPLSYSFCVDAAICREPLVVSDARLEPQLRGSPAIEEMDVVAYLGVPLITSEGHALGALCVIDSQPRTWTRDQVELTETLARAVLDHIVARAASQ